MPRVSKRKSEPVRSSEPAPKKITKEVDKINSFFATYANASIGMIDPEGVEKLCSDLNLKHTDIKVLMLAWKMNAKKQGYFTQDEWQTGLKSLHANTLKKLKKQLPVLVKEVKEKFEDFYCFSFRYCLTEDKQKNLDIETACELLKLLLHSPYDLQVDYFIEYLQVQKEYKVLNMDQWTGFYRFCNEIEFPDMKNYDESEAWPIILDSFVVWLKEKFA